MKHISTKAETAVTMKLLVVYQRKKSQNSTFFVPCQYCWRAFQIPNSIIHDRGTFQIYTRISCSKCSGKTILCPHCHYEIGLEAARSYMERQNMTNTGDTEVDYHLYGAIDQATNYCTECQRLCSEDTT